MIPHFQFKFTRNDFIQMNFQMQVGDLCTFTLFFDKIILIRRQVKIGIA